MAKGFRPVDRDQRFLLPPDMREWLPADHLVWFVLDAVEALDLAGFRAGYKLGRAGRAAYDPTSTCGCSTIIHAPSREPVSLGGR